VSFKNVYKGKRVLVTGHTGFKGSWLSWWLLQLGAEVYGIALEPKTKQDNFVVTGLENKIHHQVCNIKNSNILIESIRDIQPQMIFHLAAQPLVKSSFDDPIDTYETNLLGTVHMLEGIRQAGSVETAVFITSDKCYRNVEWEWGYRETDELGGFDPYGASKACAELAIDSHRASFFNTSGTPVIASARAGNVIGGGDWSEKRIVPDIIRALIADQTIELRSPQATRPWQFVLEPLSGYLWLGAKMALEGDLSSGWNFGPEESKIVTVGKLTEKMIQMWGSGSIKDISDKNQFHEATLLALDISKARHHLGWRPTLTLDETIQFTVQWYKQFSENNFSSAIVEKQIKDYSEKAKERGIQWAM
jgi:CDP-glucose 4,6-dehydratase